MTAIFLHQKSGERLEVLVDTDDLKRLIIVRGTFHVRRMAKGCLVVCEVRTAKGYQYLQLNRLIAGADEGEKVIHLDGNGLNCRKSNLRGGNLIGR